MHLFFSSHADLFSLLLVRTSRHSSACFHWLHEKVRWEVRRDCCGHVSVMCYIGVQMTDGHKMDGNIS